MSPTYFFDTSAMVKLYHSEAGTERVEEVFNQLQSPVVISELEPSSSMLLSPQGRMGDITVLAHDEAMWYLSPCIGRIQARS